MPVSTKALTPIPQTKSERLALAMQGQTIVSKALDEGRGLTKAEQETIDLIKDLADQIKAEADSLAVADAEDAKARDERRAKSAETARALDRLGKGATLGTDGQPIGGLFSAKQRDDLIRAVKSKTPIGLDTTLTNAHFKAAATVGALNLPGFGSDVVTAPEGRAVVSLRDYMDVTTNATSPVRWYSLSNPADASVAIVPEGGLKPESSLDPDDHDDPLIKIATWFGVTDELAEDAPFMVAAIQNTIVRAVMVKENRYVLDRVDATSGILTGTTTADGLIDTLAAQIATSEALTGESPQVLLMNPTQVGAIRQQKMQTSGIYVSDPLGPGPTSIHGVPVASTPAVAAGVVYLMTAGWGRFYTRGRGDLRVEVGLATGDFEHNRTSVRVEERVLATVPQPSRVTRLTVTA
ncbi:phage major capsid protein [Nocardioides sp. NPDC023903]|uniref:phage major capsid protein n=1 Tax=Nocardioides sp. NPDC023903 TaxID=3157195 RepID=UPI0033F0212C